MAFKAGAIVTRLELEKAKWEQSIKAVKDDQRSLQGYIVRNSKEIKDLGRGMTIAGAAITATFGVLLKKTADAGDAINDLSQRTGIGTELLSAYKLAADKSGSSLEGFAAGMRGLSRVMDDAKDGGQEAVGAFKDVGVSATDATGNLRPLDQVMLDIADRFATMPDGPEKSALAMRLFSKSGAELIPMLNMGRKGLEENAEAARRLGIVFTQEAAAACDEFNDSVADLQGAAGGLGKEIALQLMPHVRSLIEGAKNAIVKVKDWAAAHPGLAEGLSKTALGLGALFTAAGPVLIVLPKLIEGLKVAKLYSAKAMIFTFSIAGVAIVGAGVAKMIRDFKELKEAGATTAEALKTQFLNLNPFKNLGDMDWFRERLDKARLGALAFLPAVKALDPALAGLITTGKELSKVFVDFGLKTKKELTEELQKAEGALRELRGSAEATPGQIKVLEEKIASLKEEMTGVTVETRSLKEQLGLTFQADTNKRIEQLNDALLLYRGKLTADQVAKIRSEIDELAKSTRVNLAPAADLVAQHVDAGLTKLEELVIKANREIEASGDYTVEQMDADMANIVSGWKKVPEGAKDATAETKGYFDGLFNDIAQGFGSTIQEWLSGATTFKDFWHGLCGDVKDAFFRVIGEMIAGWTVNFVKKIIGDTLDIGKSIAKNIGNALGGAGNAAGSMAGSFLSAASSIANIVTAVASVINLFKKAPTGAADGMGRVVERQDIQTSLLTQLRDLARSDIGAQLDDIKKTSWSMNDKAQAGNNWLKSINAGIQDLVKKIQPAAEGYVGTVSRPTLFLAGEKRPENIVITPIVPGGGVQQVAMNPVAKAKEGGAGQEKRITLTIPIYIGTRLIKQEIISLVEGGSQTGRLRQLSSRSFAGA